MDFIANVVNGLVQNLPLLLQYAQQIVDNFGQSLSANMPNIILKVLRLSLT